MGQFITNFATTAEFTAAEATLAQPHVSLTKDNMQVHYIPLTPTPSDEFVEIGGIKWATMNIGATAITDTGLYFQWGDTQGYTADQVGRGSGQKYFDWADYIFTPNGINWGDPNWGITKYNNTDGKTALEALDDAAQAAWGGNWRMPTHSEFQALSAAVNTAWTSSYEGSGVAGLILTSKSDSNKKLFFPAAGYCYYGGFNDVGSYGYYWSSSLDTDDATIANYLLFTSSGWSSSGDHDRCMGSSVRAVLGE